MTGSLEGPLAKLARAQRQSTILQAEIDTDWPPLKVWPVTSKADRAGREYRFYLGDLPPIDPDWALWAGEIIFDLRSALDHLAYQLHVHRWPRANPAKFERVSAFPIFDDRSKFESFGARKIALLGHRDRRAIEHLQPYVTLNDRWRFLRPALDELETVHNIDKHRKLHVVTASNKAHLILGGVPEWWPEPIWGPTKSKGHVETWHFAKRPATLPDHPGAFLSIALEYRNGSMSLVPFLQSLTRGVRETLTRFADRFG